MPTLCVVCYALLVLFSAHSLVLQHEGKPYKTPVNRSVHYSRCQLYIAEHKTKSGADGRPGMISYVSNFRASLCLTVHFPSVFARRVGVRNPCWDPINYRWKWDRVLLATDPPVSGLKKVPFQWPTQEVRDHKERQIPSLSLYRTFFF